VEKKMRFRILVVALFAVFAAGAVMAATAMAEELLCVKVASGLYLDSECLTEVTLGTGPFEDLLFLLAEWLLNGAAVTTPVLVEATGELLLEDTNVLGLKAQVLCSGILDGFVEAESLDLITDVLSLLGGEVSLIPLEGTALACTNEANCPEPLVWAVKLPWPTEVELMEADGVSYFIVLILNEPGWHVECMGSLSDECKAPEGAFELTLEGASLLALFSDTIATELAGQKLATCTLGGAETGVVEEELEGSGTIVPAEGGELTASSDGISS
jgi:hypothetical protein